ncbi:MAG: hypothetical protein KDK23_06120 [Leptospiraceae bacterium]|nr:hypothetical protein [Leptospiraceae bacterium]
MLAILNYIVIGTGILLACWGLFHQLIVGGAVAMLGNPDEKEARIVIMAWVAQGAFMTFCGLIPLIFFIFYGYESPAYLTATLMAGLAMCILAIHVAVVGFATLVRPVQIGAVLEAIFGFMVVLKSLLATFLFG